MTVVAERPAEPAAARMRIGDRAVAVLTRRAGRPVTRRSFLVRVAVFASALVVNPLRYILRPGTAYASLCGPDAGCESGIGLDRLLLHRQRGGEHVPARFDARRLVEGRQLLVL